MNLTTNILINEDRKRASNSLMEHLSAKSSIDSQLKREDKIVKDSLNKCINGTIELINTDDYTTLNIIREYITSGLATPLNVRNFIGKLQRIGAPSANGFAMTNGKFIIKSSRDVNESLLHEYFVGTYGTNILRKYIPNYAFIFGTFNCSVPYFKNINSNEVITYCENNNTSPYVIYEKINGITLTEALNTLTINELASILSQLILAIDQGKDIEFTHYDLHTDNVIVMDTNVNIKYNLFQLYSNKVPVIIDYGMSHIKYEERNYGYSNPRMGVYRDKYYPIYDVYKLITSTMYELYKIGSPLYNEFEPILEFFTSVDNKVSFLSVARRTYFCLPDGFENISVEYFWNSFWYPLINNLITKSEGNTFGCKDNCLTKKQVLDNYVKVDWSNPYYYADKVNCQIENDPGRINYGSYMVKLDTDLRKEFKKMVGNKNDFSYPNSILVGYNKVRGRDNYIEYMNNLAINMDSIVFSKYILDTMMRITKHVHGVNQFSIEGNEYYLDKYRSLNRLYRGMKGDLEKVRGDSVKRGGYYQDAVK